jgi:hypothetical protein
MLCHQSTSVISDSSFKRKQFPAVRIFSGEICKLVETARVQDSDALVMGMCHCGNDFGDNLVSKSADVMLHFVIFVLAH